MNSSASLSSSSRARGQWNSTLAPILDAMTRPKRSTPLSLRSMPSSSSSSLFPPPPPLLHPRPRSRRSTVSVASSSSSSSSSKRSPNIASADVVVVGGGIVGLWCSLSLLRCPENFTVALVEAEPSTAGVASSSGTAALPLPLPRATGAGQGYLWLAHRPPGTPAWDFAVDSMALWRSEVSFDSFPSSPSNNESHRHYERTQWAARGSLLVAPDPIAGLASCEARAEALLSAGVAGARPLGHRELSEVEPALRGFERGAGGLLLPTDVQVNGRGAAADLLARCFEEGSGSRNGKQRFSVVAGQTAESIVVRGSDDDDDDDDDDENSSVATGVRMASGDVVGVRRAVVVAAGVWSGALLDRSRRRRRRRRSDRNDDDDDETSGDSSSLWRRVFSPRRGHLLDVRVGGGNVNSDDSRLRHGIMEMSYAKHYDPKIVVASSSSSSKSSETTTSNGDSSPPPPSSSSSSAATAENRNSSRWFEPTPEDDALGIVFTAAPSDDSGRTWLVGSSREEEGEEEGEGDENDDDRQSKNNNPSSSSLLDLCSRDGCERARGASRPSSAVVEAVLRRAALFLPELERFASSSSSSSSSNASSDASSLSSPLVSARVGLRPASVSGMPVIGRVSLSSSADGDEDESDSTSNSNVIVAAGHEGSGLTLAPATAALVATLVSSGVAGRGLELPSYYDALRPERALREASKVAAAAAAKKKKK